MSILELKYIPPTRPYSQKELLKMHENLFNSLKIGNNYVYLDDSCYHFYFTKSVISNKNKSSLCLVCKKMKETKDVKDKITEYCLDFIKKDEVKKELKNLFKPVINLILEEIYPYIYLSLLLVVISFFLVLGIFIMLIKSHKTI